MNEFQKELLNIRNDIINAVKSELMGPGSEVSYPDAEHELISENPSDRYSVGILYPQNNRFDDGDLPLQDQTDSLEDDEEEDLSNDSEEDEHISDVQSKNVTKDDYDDEMVCNEKMNCFDDEVNLAQQNKPSSMGLTFFISDNINHIGIEVQYAKYRLAKENEIVIPCNLDDLYIPDCLLPYISFDRENKTIRKKQAIKRRDLSDIFEQNRIEDPELLNIIRNLNWVFKNKRAYRRQPYNEKVSLTFDGNMAKTSLENINGYITAVKHHVVDNIFSITIMMVNADTRKNECVYQPKIIVDSKDLGGIRFVNYNKTLNLKNLDAEEQSLALLYKNKIVYGTGHGVAVDWEVKDGIGKVFTEFMPLCEAPKINLELRRDTEAERAVPARSLSMKYLSDLDDTDQNSKLADMFRFIDCYGLWICNLENELTNPEFDARYIDVAKKHIDLCREAFERMKDGLEILKNDNNAWKAFLLTNRAMYIQRIHGAFQKEEHYPDDEEFQNKISHMDYTSFSEDAGRWRPFQLAFMLMSIRSMTDPESKERDIVDLIWFQTGGGKTEAYLGLTAFSIFHRRLLNPDNGGTTVIMRYTLRLLTSQQFTRASTLICACEKIRRDEEIKGFKKYNLGKERITIGMWIGGDHIPNTNLGAKKEYDELVKNVGSLQYRKDKHNKFQVLKCPWCGTKLTVDEVNGKEIGMWGYRFRKKKDFYLSCTQEGCEFEACLPVQIIDEELYENPPTLLFATVDKFAMMAWKKEIKAFFGSNGNDAPDLIIQDELHLIAGPLGSMVGIYETAIDYLCSQNGHRPKIIASTATIRQAEQQCRAIYNREMRQFPAPGLDASDSFFAKEIPVNDDFGRSYLGIMPSGKKKVMMLARTTAIALQSVHQLACDDSLKDQFYTLAVYFNSLKDLGKASSVVSDDVKDFIKRITYREIVREHSSRIIGMPYELTSRIKTSELNYTLDKLENAVYSKENIDDKKYPINVLLASNMISVGVDVSRLNLMLIQGQPKSVSEYIQASSRIGRTNPGLAIALYDSAKSRDRSYYEQFKAFHNAFYRYVEPTGVTPFASPVRDRALHAVLLSCVRQSLAEFNSDVDAGNITDDSAIKKVQAIIDFIFNRAKTLNSFNPVGMEDDSESVRNELENFLNDWTEKAENSDDLVFGDAYVGNNASKDVNRLIKRFDDKCGDYSRRTLTSLRSVDKTVGSSVLIWEKECD